VEEDFVLDNKFIVLSFHSYWREKRFSLGINLCSEKWNKRESYILFCLGFWLVSIGFKI
jgi:hypothetical protein